MHTFKPIGALVLALTLFTVLLAGCQDTDTPDVQPTETPAGIEATAEPTAAPTEIPTPAPTAEPLEMTDTLNTLTGWGEGSAGCSLKVVSSANELITWADDQQAAQLDPMALQGGISLWLETIESDLQGSVKGTWLWVKETGGQLLEKDPDLELILGDINQTYPESETALTNWTALCDAIDTVLEPIEAEVVDP